MVQRHFWLERLERAWRERPVVWLAGVRRAGKTCLCQTLPDTEYFDCELARVRRTMEDLGIGQRFGIGIQVRAGQNRRCAPFLSEDPW
jgi:hypothetical protein